MMKGFYRILLNNRIEIYTDTDDIPEEFDNLIDFAPEYPKGPHTEEEHQMIDGMGNVLRELLNRELR